MSHTYQVEYGATRIKPFNADRKSALKFARAKSRNGMAFVIIHKPDAHTIKAAGHIVYVLGHRTETGGDWNP